MCINKYKFFGVVLSLFVVILTACDSDTVVKNDASSLAASSEFAADDFDSLLLDYVRSGQYDELKLLLTTYRDNINIDATDAAGNTGLMIAAFRGQGMIAQLLLDHGADPNRVADNGDTALIMAARYTSAKLPAAESLSSDEIMLLDGNVPTADILLLGGADIDATNNDGYSALIMAVANNNVLMANFLVRSSANLELHEAINGKTALMIAAENGNESIVTLLLRSGANIDAKDSNGKRAVRYAYAHFHDQIALMLGIKPELLEQRDELDN